MHCAVTGAAPTKDVMIRSRSFIIFFEVSYENRTRNSKYEEGFFYKEVTGIKKSETVRFTFCCPTWIRTKTNRTKICRTTIILSGNPFPFQGCKNRAIRSLLQKVFQSFWLSFSYTIFPCLQFLNLIQRTCYYIAHNRVQRTLPWVGINIFQRFIFIGYFNNRDCFVCLADAFFQ